MTATLTTTARAGWFTEAEDRLREELTEHFARQVEPHIPAWESAGEIPLRDILTALGERGMLGLRFPVERGGAGHSAWSHVVLAECLGELSSDSVGMSVTVHNDMVAPMIAEAGGPEAVERHLRPALTGRHLLAHAVSEPGAGSDVAAVATTAVPVDGGYRVSGTKQWVIAGMYADAYAVLARLPEAKPPFGYVLLMVPRSAEGVTVGPADPTLGMRAAGVAGSVRLDEVFVPQSDRLGGHGLGLVTQLRQFEPERIVSACRALAIAARLLRDTRARLAERSTFGESVGSRQEIVFRLARLEADIAAARQLAYTGIDRWVAGGDHRTVSAAVKLRSSRLTRRVARECLHLYGAQGQLTEEGVNRAFRDARLFSISTGSDEMMLTALARLNGWADD
ncbi:acyl-CoA dehydrogenase family protein [Streptomyces sp. TRM66268-LWL]|uniref:Acyl-CoA dehydrogenase family protein n=1 Tax=Streptomyces polyasparticus TaxID=2767826 RepID=A0ABR7SMI6_9ACTN|nr:acyl-CoA dehydrogenase family protein [Streptomyces polyasparticus]MBC9716064.1 acyl-CoA dehydrogenase family protein [Streptomyces polyasparticus]